MIDLAPKTPATFDVRRFGLRETARRHDVVTASELAAFIVAYKPPRRIIIPACRFDSGFKGYVPAQVVFGDDMPQVAKNLGLRGVFLRPMPFSLELRIEAV